MTTRINRRLLLAMMGAGGASALAACAGPGSTGGGEQEAPETDGAIEGEVSFAHWRAEDQAAFDEMIATFTAEHADVSITQDITPSNDYQSQALNRLESAAVGDIFPTFRGAQFTQFVDAGVYTDLSDQDFVGNYESGLIEAGQSDGAQMGLPYQVVLSMPVGNLDILSDVGYEETPTTWDGFLDMCDKVKSKGITPMAWPGGDVGNAGQLYNSMIMNLQPEEDSSAQLEAGTMKCTDDWFLEMLAKYAELRPYFQSNATGTSVEPIQQMFVDGEAAMLVTGSYHIAAVRDLGAEFPMGMYPPITADSDPKHTGTYNATFILGINTASDVQPAATEFLRFLSDPVNAQVYADATVQHVSVSGVEYSNPDLMELSPWLEREDLMLAARFQFDDLDIRNAVEGACIEVVGGTEPEAAAEKAQGIIDERL